MADILDRLKAALADRSQIERELGSCGMATLYLARDLKHERQVAVKVIRPELAAALGSNRFLRGRNELKKMLGPLLESAHTGPAKTPV